MAKKKKKKPPGLPRVTLLAYSARDLLAFTEAVEGLRHAVADLKVIKDEMKAKAVRKKPAAAAIPPTVPSEPAHV